MYRVTSHLFAPDIIINHRADFHTIVPAGIPENAQQEMHKAIDESIDGIEHGDPAAANDAIRKIHDISQVHPKALQAWWGSCGGPGGCGGYLTGGTVMGAGIYATCYWSCVAANAWEDIKGDWEVN
jgi:hypothetical protein